VLLKCLSGRTDILSWWTWKYRTMFLHCANYWSYPLHISIVWLKPCLFSQHLSGLFYCLLYNSLTPKHHKSF